MIHNQKLMLFSIVGYSGMVFIVLSLAQLANDLEAFDPDEFLGFMIGFVAVFGILYVGHSFPAFRTKETTITYLTVPASAFEKFVFEFISRVGIILVMLPILFWLVYHLQGYFFKWLADTQFVAVGFAQIQPEITPEADNLSWIYVIVGASSLLALILPFTGSAMFGKQPLVKTLFTVALIILSFTAFTWFVLDPLGLQNYRAHDSMWLIPTTELAALRLFGIGLIVANLTMLTVAFLKIKEKEV